MRQEPEIEARLQNCFDRTRSDADHGGTGSPSALKVTSGRLAESG
ncbi:hypothetical protein OKA04_18035 [Luteolibacter flavescens]|uniref:Uncharacterized protein n=1 Tax=Luteolibacter flavescens TaxID=1859460 RepID=A0ABT3FST6_9BACT|nr:hypothetical protein [Luteolibacter flavescens]MCW1886644.1 hypothetical protein [Luteolibacter flavescens]